MHLLDNHFQVKTSAWLENDHNDYVLVSITYQQNTQHLHSAYCRTCNHCFIYLRGNQVVDCEGPVVMWFCKYWCPINWTWVVNVFIIGKCDSKLNQKNQKFKSIFGYFESTLHLKLVLSRRQSTDLHYMKVSWLISKWYEFFWKVT